jgi:tRNA A-37 threonylcarbamoyl transferase component Bud32
MPKTIAGLSEDVLRRWIGASIREKKNFLGHGYQCHTLLYRDAHRSLVVKAPIGRGPAAQVRRLMLRREHAVYTRVAGLPGIADCHGFLDRRYLVLGFVEGVAIGEARITDRDAFFGDLLRQIEGLHRAGVAHGDLKKKDNILVVDGRRPALLDFGVAVIRKSAPAPVNHYLFDLFKAFDLNAYVKLKYRNRLDGISAADRLLYRRTAVEKSAGWVKRRYLAAKERLIGH